MTNNKIQKQQKVAAITLALVRKKHKTTKPNLCKQQ